MKRLSLFKQASNLKQLNSVANRNFTKYEGYKRVTLIPGDGLGPEIMAAVVDLFRIAKVPVKWDTHLVKGSFIDVNVDSFKKEEGTTPRPRAQPWDPEIHAPEVHQSIMENKIVLKGPFLSTIGRGVTSVDKMLALKYDLFGHVTIIKTPPFPDRIPGIFKNLDFVMIKEQTEAEYSGLEHEVIPGVVESLKVVTEDKSLRIAEYAFKYAKATNRSKVVAVHKANIMKLSDGLFLKCCKQVAERYPDIKFQDVIVDNMAMQLITKPQQFNDCVIVTTNLYGSIIANTAAALIGGAGITAGFATPASGDDAITMFEQGTRHLGVDIANRNMANPTGLIKSAVYMLHHIGLTPYANQISNALERTIKDGKYLTQDVGGTSTTSEYLQAIINNLEAPNFASQQPPSEQIVIKV